MEEALPERFIVPRGESENTVFDPGDFGRLEIDVFKSNVGFLPELEDP